MADISPMPVPKKYSGRQAGTMPSDDLWDRLEALFKCNSGIERASQSRSLHIVWTYGHFASIIPVLYVFCCLLKNTSKIRPFSKVKGRGSMFCPEAAKNSNLKSIFEVHVCEDLIDLSGTQILVLVVPFNFSKHKCCRF
jgi:hypothetical protein